MIWYSRETLLPCHPIFQSSMNTYPLLACQYNHLSLLLTSSKVWRKVVCAKVTEIPH